MPTYDYRCERTGEMFEFWQSFADDALTLCPQVHKGESDECGAPVKKVFSKVGISFKGEGFYKNDHGRKSSKETTDTSPSADSGAKSDSSSSSTSSDSSSSTSSTSSSSTSSSSDKKSSGKKSTGSSSSD